MSSPIGAADPWELVHRASREPATGVPAAGRTSAPRHDDPLPRIPDAPSLMLSPEALAYLSKQTPESIERSARALADAGVGLRDSFARAHRPSIAETQLSIDAYIAYTASKPELAVLHARAVADAPDVLADTQAAIDEAHLHALEREV